VELVCLLEELGGELPDPAPVDVDTVLRLERAGEVVAGVGDRRYRERLYRRLKHVRETDWAEQYHRAFFAESDLRIMSQLYEELVRSGPERAAPRVIAESVSQPRQAPRAFVWVARNAARRDELGARANHALLSKVIDALDAPEFRELKARLREQFEEGGLAFAVFESSDRDGVDHLLNMIDSATSLEEHRKTGIRRAIFRKYPDIRKRTDEDAVFVTAEAIEDKRAEFEQLVKQEIPQNAEAIRVAREYGDLRENFEYHAARQKHEVLNARAAQLHDDLKKARAIDPHSVESGKVGIGARFDLHPVLGGDVRPVTILGPWDSDPDRGVYSYLSEFAVALLGCAVGEEVEVDGNRYRIAGIRPWRNVPEMASEPGTARESESEPPESL
jgi:transcription elongation GreA/GreB family factor